MYNWKYSCITERLEEVNFWRKKPEFYQKLEPLLPGFLKSNYFINQQSCLSFLWTVNAGVTPEVALRDSEKLTFYVISWTQQ